MVLFCRVNINPNFLFKLRRIFWIYSFWFVDHYKEVLALNFPSWLDLVRIARLVFRSLRETFINSLAIAVSCATPRLHLSLFPSTFWECNICFRMYTVFEYVSATLWFCIDCVNSWKFTSSARHSTLSTSWFWWMFFGNVCVCKLEYVTTQSKVMIINLTVLNITSEKLLAWRPL